MKHIYRSLAPLCMAASIPLFAQPVITTGMLTYQPGDTYLLSTCGELEPGPPGPDQTWDHGTIVGCGTPTTITWEAPPVGTTSYDVSQRFGSMSPSAYFQSEPDAFRMTIRAPLPNDVFTFTDPKDVFRFPFAYQENFTEAFDGVRVFGASSETFQGSRTVTYDAYGTLAVPGWGTFTDVVRLHVVEQIEYAVSTFLSNTEEQYLYFRPEVHQPVLSIISYTSLSSGTTSHYSRLHLAPATGMTPTEPSISLLAYPNPTDGMVNLTTTRAAHVEVLDPQGRVLIEAANITDRSTLDLTALQAGAYLVRVLDTTGSSTFHVLKR